MVVRKGEYFCVTVRGLGDRGTGIGIMDMALGIRAIGICKIGGVLGHQRHWCLQYWWGGLAWVSEALALAILVEGLGDRCICISKIGGELGSQWHCCLQDQWGD